MKNQILTTVAMLLAIVLTEATMTQTVSAQSTKKIVLLAGMKTHGPGEHEYLKTVRLLKAMLDNAPNLKGLRTEIHDKGWPENPSTLDDADLILVYADGSDDKEDHDPLLTGNHLTVLEKQMNRGCGLILLHYSTFAPKRYSAKFLEWAGGYFDYENGKPGASGEDAWYSAIKTETAKVKPATGHPIAQGVTPFDLHEEFYFKIHFPASDKNLRPVLKVSITGVESEQTIAWSTQRSNGGRGFGFTGGHFYNNWEIPDYRKLILNAIVWTAGAAVPPEGVESKYYSDEEVRSILNDQ